jgi:GTP-binding protein
MFVDEAEIFVRSGKGGDGMVHFHREKYVSKGGPDGGDGGRGGDVILEVTPSMNTLASFRHITKYHADPGKNGGPNNMSGRGAEDLVIKVPAGTLVYDAANGELLADLVQIKQRYTVCKGGRGGRGNQHFATSRNQVPRIGEKGEPAQDKHLKLELKLIADVGIVGVPNAGKSSLLASVSNANPKIANYPFTTLEPNLGVTELDQDTTMVLADIPGLIEGAHRGAGLGDSFLRHIQRTRVLIHLLDGLSDDPMADFTQINAEMALFDANLAQKPQVVVLNKMDLPDVQEKWKKLEKQLAKRGYPVMSISAVTGENVKPLLWKAYDLLKTAPPPPVAQELPVYKPAEDVNAFTIEHNADGWVVRGAAIERAAAMTYWEHEGSVRRFQRLMETLGVDAALREAGVQEGDTVYVADNELEWQD